MEKLNKPLFQVCQPTKYSTHTLVQAYRISTVLTTLLISNIAMLRDNT